MQYMAGVNCCIIGRVTWRCIACATESASCESLRCAPDTRCALDVLSRVPSCVECPPHECAAEAASASSRQRQHAVCASFSLMRGESFR